MARFRVGMSFPVTIVAYNPEWPAFYENERKLVQSVIGANIIQIDHIGSTAVPGLGAKPIIDILASMESQEIADNSLPYLAEIGYTDVTPEPQEPDWFFCLGKHSNGQVYHLHIVKHGTAHWKKHIVFRDILRLNPDVAEEYFELKKELASKFRDDRVAFTDGKAEFIERNLVGRS